jgi:hypothetical protein
MHGPFLMRTARKGSIRDSRISKTLTLGETYRDRRSNSRNPSAREMIGTGPNPATRCPRAED